MTLSVERSDLVTTRDPVLLTSSFRNFPAVILVSSLETEFIESHAHEDHSLVSP